MENRIDNRDDLSVEQCKRHFYQIVKDKVDEEKELNIKDKEIAKLKAIIKDMVHQVLMAEMKLLDMERAATVNTKKES